jgi:hypothetical protein
LAAAIEEKFGITPKLKEGHNDIYEVAINGDIFYTNQKECGRFPENKEIFQEISRYKDPLPGQDMRQHMHEGESADPCCSWSPPAGNQKDD